MKVKFKNTWFAPNGFRFRVGVQNVPDQFRDMIPSSAEILPGDYVAPVEAKGRRNKRITGLPETMSEATEMFAMIADGQIEATE